MNNNQEQKNNIINETKGRGLFYGVIAVATFIIMAVGATFAYFTATTESMNAAVQTGSTTLQLKYISYGTAWMKDDLIPADTAIVEYSVENQNDTTITVDDNEEYAANGKNTICKDDYGNSICSVYVFQVTNTAASPQTVSLDVVSETNGFSSLNAMAYEISIPEDDTDYNSTENYNGLNDPIFRKSSDDETEGAIDVTDGQGILLSEDQYTPVYFNRKGITKTLLKWVESVDPDTSATVTKPAIDRLLVSLSNEGDQYKTVSERTQRIADNISIEGNGTTKTFALVLYIKNATTDQTATDAEKIFQGQVVVSSGDGGTGVSGQIGLATEEAQQGLQSNQ